MLPAINQYCRNYYNQIPLGSLRTASLSAAFSFSASVLLLAFEPSTIILSRASAAAGIAFIASAIHIVTTPIFNYIFNNPHHQFNGWQEIIKSLTSRTLAHILVNYSIKDQINLISFATTRYGVFIVIASNIVKCIADIMCTLQTYPGRHPNPVYQAAAQAGYQAGFRGVMARSLRVDFNVNTLPMFFALPV